MILIESPLVTITFKKKIWFQFQFQIFTSSPVHLISCTEVRSLYLYKEKTSIRALLYCTKLPVWCVNCPVQELCCTVPSSVMCTLCSTRALLHCTKLSVMCTLYSKRALLYWTIKCVVDTVQYKTSVVLYQTSLYAVHKMRSGKITVEPSGQFCSVQCSTTKHIIVQFNKVQYSTQASPRFWKWGVSTEWIVANETF